MAADVAVGSGDCVGVTIGEVDRDVAGETEGVGLGVGEGVGDGVGVGEGRPTPLIRAA
jgi:hypothetical protein